MMESYRDKERKRLKQLRMKKPKIVKYKSRVILILKYIRFV